METMAMTDSCYSTGESDTVRLTVNRWMMKSTVHYFEDGYFDYYYDYYCNCNNLDDGDGTCTIVHHQMMETVTAMTWPSSD